MGTDNNILANFKFRKYTNAHIPHIHTLLPHDEQSHNVHTETRTRDDMKYRTLSHTGCQCWRFQCTEVVSVSSTSVTGAITTGNTLYHLA